MKMMVMLTVAAAIAAAGAVQAQTQAQTNGQAQAETPESMQGWTKKVDLASVLCKQLPDLSKPQVEQMVIWLQGFYTLEGKPRIIDPGKVSTDITKLIDYCKQNPEANMVAAADDVMGE